MVKFVHFKDTFMEVFTEIIWVHVDVICLAVNSCMG